MDTREKFLYAILIRIVILLLILTALPLVLGAQDVAPAWERTLQLSNPVQIGDLRLPAGEFTVRHAMEGDRHMLVLQQKKKGAPPFRTPCTLVRLSVKADNDEQLYRHGPAGEWSLVGLIVKGDNVEHRF